MKKLTRQWARKAEADFTLARRLLKAKPPFHDSLCFHCQQAAEKYLKALLQERGLTVLRTHNLVDLHRLLLPNDPSLRAVRRGLKTLTRYAVDYRYPGFSANSRKAQAALRWAERLRREIRLRLGLPDRPKRR
jgi:HEPN domain-containing protein